MGALQTKICTYVKKQNKKKLASKMNKFIRKCLSFRFNVIETKQNILVEKLYSRLAEYYFCGE